ncbi:MAG: helix-turn-helix domain-containing protein [Pyrinomonadaceae bacterium]
MSLTLGEKLRKVREERGISLSEVAEQTRISTQYLESIENDDYRSLPGGIFNKGFVKSFAKYVGLEEQEALADYSALLAATNTTDEPTLKLYKPEVLTDERTGSSMIPTAIVAVIILALMTTGILFLVNYLRQPATPVAANTNQKANTNAAGSNTSVPDATVAGVPDMASVKVEFKALNQPVPLNAISDGSKSDKMVGSGTSALFEPKESLTINYNKWNADKIQMTINGKAITLPAVPLEPKGKRIEFTINKENLARIWTSGTVSTDVPAVVTDANANLATAPLNGAPPTTTTTVRQPSVPKPTGAANAAANTTAKPTNTANPPTMTGKPPTMSGKPPVNRP